MRSARPATTPKRASNATRRPRPTGIVTQPWSTGITLQVLPRSNVDKIPILAPGYGFSPMADGKVFQWAFNPPASLLGRRVDDPEAHSGGNLDSLKGKKIVLLHLDPPYGKEPIPLIESLAEKHGFTLLPIPVGVKEMQNQSAQWLQIRRENPDFVLMWGWGAMNAGALTEAVKTKFPMDKFIGIWWSGHDGDMKASARRARATGRCRGACRCPSRRRCRTSRNTSRSQEKTRDRRRRVRLGVLSARRPDLDVLGRGDKAAQANFNTKVVNAEQLRWGLENLKIDEAKLAEIGMTGMIAPFSTNCANHTGHGRRMDAGMGRHEVRQGFGLAAGRQSEMLRWSRQRQRNTPRPTRPGR